MDAAGIGELNLPGQIEVVTGRIARVNNAKTLLLYPEDLDVEETVRCAIAISICRPDMPFIMFRHNVVKIVRDYLTNSFLKSKPQRINSSGGRGIS